MSGTAPGIADDVTAVVLAGGRGTRIAALHPTTPKPMIPVLGRPFLHWLTAYLARQGIRRFVYATGYLAEQIEAWTRDDSLPGLSRIVRREDAPLGTGGGLVNCLDLCGPWTLVVNGDGLCLGGIGDLLALAGRPGADGGLVDGGLVDGGLVGVRVADTARYGSLETSDDGRLLRFREKVPGQGTVNGGVYLFRTALLATRPLGPQSLERDVLPDLLAGGARLRVVQAGDAPFIDIGLPETLRTAEDFVRTHL